MLKGHTKIELTNVNTQEVTTYEADNLVTNAISEILTNAMPYANNHNMDGILPIYTYLTSGILLFTNPLEENVENIAMPNFYSNPVVACSGDNTTVTADDSRRGVKISTGTQALDNGYQYVWSWDTTQGNGTFSTLCLTSKWNGYAPYRQQDSTRSNGLSINTTHLTNIIDYNYNDKTWFNWYTKGGTTLYVDKKQLAYFTYASGNCKVGDTVTLESNEYALFQTVPTDAIWVDGNDGYVYCLIKDNNSQCTVLRVDKTTHTQDENWNRTLTSSGAAWLNLRSGGRNAIIVNNYLYIGFYNGTIERWLLTSTNPVNEILDCGNSNIHFSDSTPSLMFNNMIYWHHYILDLQSLSFMERPENTNWGEPFVYGSTEYFSYVLPCGITNSFTHRYMYVQFTGAYLATINNLEAPITKTSEQTMRITYTLTEE